MAGNKSKWQAEVISSENGRQRVQMAGRTHIVENGRQNWQANSYSLKMAGNDSKWQAELIFSQIGRQRVKMAGRTHIN